MCRTLFIKITSFLQLSYTIVKNLKHACSLRMVKPNSPLESSTFLWVITKDSSWVVSGELNNGVVHSFGG